MEIHQIIPILVTIGLAWSGFLVGVIRWLQSKNEEALSARLTSIEKSITEVKAELAQMPKSYVLKDDCRDKNDNVLQQLALINRKMDEQTKMILDVRRGGFSNA